MSNTPEDFAPIAVQPSPEADLQEWIDWFWNAFLPAWVHHAHDPEAIGLFDVLDKDTGAVQPERRTILAQARLFFTFSHLALLSDNPAYHRAAQITRDSLASFRKAPGLYRTAVSATGEPTGKAEDELATSYNQSFVILGLATWGRLHPDEDVTDELEALWTQVETTLRDPKTGLMLEHDALADPAAADAPYRAQNPHMHLYEAALQAFEMTRDPIWLERAGKMRAKGLEYFFDAETGSMAEFIAADLSVAAGVDGQRREIGHQCEWAWLLTREVELGGDPKSGQIAARLTDFAQAHGYATTGVMTGAVYDAVADDLSWTEERFLLWPQTEAIKADVVRANDPEIAKRAQRHALLMFQRYFSGHAGYVNQLDASGDVIWDEGLSRLLYHIVVAMTEGARMKLWQGPGQ